MYGHGRAAHSPASREPLIPYFAVALRAQLCRDTARREGNGRSPCRGPQHSIGTIGAQPIDVCITSVGPGRIAQITALQWLDRPKGMLSPSGLVLRTIRHRRSREIIDQRFPRQMTVKTFRWDRADRPFPHCGF